VISYWKKCVDEIMKYIDLNKNTNQKIKVFIDDINIRSDQNNDKFLEILKLSIDN